MAPRTDRTTRIPSGVASPITTNHQQKGPCFVNFKNCSTSHTMPTPALRIAGSRAVPLSLPRVRVSGFGFRVSTSGFRLPGFGFRVLGFEFRVSGFGFRVSSSGILVPGFGFRSSGFGFQDLCSVFSRLGLDSGNAGAVCSFGRTHLFTWTLLRQVPSKGYRGTSLIRNSPPPLGPP